MLAIVQKDIAGLFTWYRDSFEASPYAQGVVAIYRGPLDKIRKEAEGFERLNRGRYVDFLSPEDIRGFLSQEETDELTCTS